MRTLKTIDAHVGGQALRLVVDGCPAPRGRTMLEKREWMQRHADVVRRVLMCEPRGHTDLCGALLTEPVSPGSHAGILFMDNLGYAPMSGHAVIAAVTIALERQLLMPGGDGRTIVLDTPAGMVRARAHTGAEGRVDRVAFLGVPAFVLYPGLALKIGSRHLRVDVAFGGAFYAIADCEGAGFGVSPAHAPELRRIGMEITQAVEAARTIAHPHEPKIAGLDGTILTAPPADGRADLRSATVFAKGAVDRSPGGTGTAAIMAVLSAMGLLVEGVPFVHESITGAHFIGRIIERTAVGDTDAIVPEIEGTAWTTGDHTFTIDDADPFREGFLL